MCVLVSLLLLFCKCKKPSRDVSEVAAAEQDWCKFHYDIVDHTKAILVLTLNGARRGW